MTTRFAPYLRLLRENSAFRRLYVAQLISFAGDWFATVALLGLVLQLTDSAAAASLVIVLQTGGFAIASPIAGVLADRLDRRRLMVAADFFRVPVALSLLLVHSSDTLWICFVALTLMAFGAAVFEPTSSAALPNLVEEDDLSVANVLLGSAWGVMLAVGAAIGGTRGGDAGTRRRVRHQRRQLRGQRPADRRHSPSVPAGSRHVASAAAQAGSAGSSQRSASPLEAFRVVFRFARRSRLLSALLLSKTMFGVGTGVILMLAVFGQQVFHGGDVAIGLLYAARGLGALIGPFGARAIFSLDNRGIIRGILASVIDGGDCVRPVPVVARRSGSPRSLFSPLTWVAARSGCSRLTGSSAPRRTRSAAASSASTTGW